MKGAPILWSATELKVAEAIAIACDPVRRMELGDRVGAASAEAKTWGSGFRELPLSFSVFFGVPESQGFRN
jgi:hypothetical protein